MKNFGEIIRVITVMAIVLGIFTFEAVTPQPVHAVSITANTTGDGGDALGGYAGGAGTYANLNIDDNATTIWNSNPASPAWYIGDGTFYKSWTHFAFSDVGNITDVKIYGWGLVTGYGVADQAFYMRNSTGTRFYGTDSIPFCSTMYGGCTWRSGYSDFTLNPQTGTNWTATALNNMEMGYRHRQSSTWSGGAGISYLWIDATYTLYGLPTAASSAATSISYGSNHQATFNGSVTDGGSIDGGCDDTGFVYSKTSQALPGNVAPGATTYSFTVSTGAKAKSATFNSVVTGLAEGTTYYYRSYVHNPFAAGGYDYSDTEQSFTTLQSVITTGAASAIGYSGSHVATLAGTLAPSGITWSQRGFAYGTTSNTTTPSNVTPPASYAANVTTTGSYTNGVYSANLSGLLEGATYYFRAYAKDSDGFWWSSTQNSWTALSHPNITTVAATEVASTSAKLNALVTWDGGQASDVRFGYDTATKASVAACGNQTGWVEDTYTTSSTPYAYIYGLAPATTYYFRAQARNDVTGDKDATNELTFTTSTAAAPPYPLTGTPTATTILLSWVRGLGSTTTYIRYSGGTYPASTADGILAANSTSSSVMLSGLTPGTTYYFRGWGWSGTGFSSSNTTLMVTTSAGVTPSNTTSTNYTAPSTMYQNTTGSGFATNPFAETVNNTAVAYEMPDTTLWMLIAIVLSMAAGIWVYSMRPNIVLALFATGVGIGFSTAMHLLPLWALITYIVFGVATIAVTARYGS